LYQTGKPARFDFDGHLVSNDADLPVHLGLHHHGQEPEVSNTVICHDLSEVIEDIAMFSLVQWHVAVVYPNVCSVAAYNP